VSRRIPSDTVSIRAFLAAIYRQPGFWLRVAGTIALFIAAAIKGGFLVAIAWTVVGLVVLFGLGYPRFRRRGRLP